MTTEPLRRIGLELAAGTDAEVALLTSGGAVTYAGLRDGVARTRDVLGTTRRLVLLEAANDLASVTTYLAALAGGHPVLLTGPGDADRHGELVARYDPDVVQTAAGGVPVELRTGSAHVLHPDLAVLMSTSGSTGSPKVVRLSHRNLVENARSIATYLGIRTTDRALTTLPLHYCYGLSVLNSHLLAGAAVVLTDLSVVNECLWDLAAQVGASSFAGVPYTFDLLDSSGFEDRDLPSLRYVTQAGGRLPAETVRRYAELGRRKGWDLYVMYGQTEATARMAYLPPDLATGRATAIGRPVPGGSFHLEPVPGLSDYPPGRDVGELVYTGPNVMMGYAEDVRDLALGATLTQLRTGDLARRGRDGLWEIVGRLNRYAKIAGLRLDLDRLERRLAAEGCPAHLVVRGERIHAFTTRARSTGQLRSLTARLTSLPEHAVRVERLDVVPMTATGKPDHAALARHADLLASRAAESPDASPGAGLATPASVRDLYAGLLGRPDATTRDSFVGLGGDSLSFVEVSVRLGRHLGDLPADWTRLSAEQLGATARPRRRFLAPVEASVLLRALAILLVVVTHADLVLLPGGAHVLLAVAGFNLARFALVTPGRLERVRRLARGVAGFAVPSVLWIVLVTLFSGAYQPGTALFLNGLVGSDAWSDDWHFWFLDALVWASLGLAALLAVPAVDRWQRAHPFGAALCALGATLALRYAWVGVDAGPTERYTVGIVLWCLATGWAAAAANTTARRALVSLVAVGGTVGFFGDPLREGVVAAGILALVWLPPISLPAMLAAPVRVVAGASLWIYLTHWQVYPGLEADGHPVLAILASVVVGVAAEATYSALRRWVGRSRRSRRSSRPHESGGAPAGFRSSGVRW